MAVQSPSLKDNFFDELKLQVLSKCQTEKKWKTALLISIVKVQSDWHWFELISMGVFFVLFNDECHLFFDNCKIKIFQH